jgi:L-amino acid N-acyltransferase YncA
MTPALRIEPMTDADWPEVRRIYAEGVETGNATLERDAPDWSHFDHSHRHDCRLVARSAPGGPILGWTALTAYSSRRVYAGVAWESVYVAASARGQGIGRALLEALIPASEASGLWTLLAGILSDNEASVALHQAVGFRLVGVQHRLGQDAKGRWRDVLLFERRSTAVVAGRPDPPRA